MRKEDVTEDLSSLAFDFFFWFSRFEFALKENGYLKYHKAGMNAEPGWAEFVERWQNSYSLSAEAMLLLQSPPERQIVLDGDKLHWRAVGVSDCKSDLAKVVRLVKTVRNNLFHGGKHGGAGWDAPKRTQELLRASLALLNQLAELTSIDADFKQHY